MLFDNKYPYTDFHELNLDWILEQVKAVIKSMNEFINLNTIKYADPIEWDITRQYEANTVVIDGSTGDAYISTKPVPTGVNITSTDYWTPIFNYQDRLAELNDKIAKEVEDREANDAILNESIDNLSKKLIDKPFINVIDYGAKGDGVTDDSQSFIDALEAAENMGATVIVPNGTYLLNTSPITPIQTVTLIQGDAVKYTGIGAGDPNYPFSNGKIQSPYCNPGNRAVNIISKHHEQPTSPAGNGSMINCTEWVAETEHDYIEVTGSIQSGSYTMTVSNTEGITPGCGIILESPILSDFPDGSTKQNTVRVTSVDPSTNSLQFGMPADNPSAWAGIANPSPWMGATITNGRFKIRKRFWNVTQFVGATSGNGNPDRIAYAQNIVTGSNGNLTYGIELDMDFGSTQQPNIDVIHKGVYVLGFGTASPLNRAIEVEHSASNWRVGLDIDNAYHGIEINALGGITISPTFFNRNSNNNEPIEYGITTSDISDPELASKHPVYAGAQPTPESSALYLKRNNNAMPSGNFIECIDATGVVPIFKVDTNGVLYIFAERFAYEQITPTHSITIKSSDGHTFKIPAQQID